MGIVYIDGLEDNGAFVGTAGTVSLVAGRTGNGYQTNGSSGRFDIRFPAPFFDTVTIGVALKMTSIASSGTSPCMITLYGDNGATPHISLNCTSGNIDVVRGNSTTPIIASAPACFSAANRWFYLEVQAKVSDTAGFVNINVDGVNKLTSATNLDTKNAGTNLSFDTISFGWGSSGNTIWDDLYLMAGAGDTFQGDCIVKTLLPNGNGFANQFVGSDGNSVDNYLLVDELPPSGADYVASATIGQQDLYTLADLSGAAGTILAVAPTVYAAKDEVGPRQVKPLLRGSATNAGAAQALDFAYAQKQSIYTTNPETSAAWTAAEVNALQVGVETA